MSYIAIYVIACIVLSPVGALIAAATCGGELPTGLLGDILLPSGRKLPLLFNSLALALYTSIACMTVAWLTGSFVWAVTRKHPKVFSYIIVFCWFMALLPPFVHAYAWLSLFTALNKVLMAIGMNIIGGFFASWWVQTMAWLSLSLCITLLGFRVIDFRLIDAARMLSAPGRIMIEIIWPLVAPAVLAGGSMVFLFCIMDYAVPSLFQVSTYSLEIFSDFSAYNQPLRAMLLSVPLITAGLAVLTVMKRAFGYVSITSPRSNQIWTGSLVLPGWLKAGQAAGIAVVAMQLIIPLIALIRSLGSSDKLIQSVASSAAELIYSIQTSLLSAGISTLLAVWAAHSPGIYHQKAIFTLTAVALVIPPALTGIGLIVLFNQPWLEVVYNTDFMPVLAALARFVPFSALIVLVQQQRSNKLLIDAARILEVNSWQTWLQIKLPMMLPGLLTAFMTVFLLTMAEFAATLLIAPPGKSTFSIKTYNLLHYGASDAVAGLVLFIVASGWLIGIFVTWLINRR